MNDVIGPFDLETSPAYAVDFEYREVTGRCGHQRLMELDGWVRPCDDCGDAAYDDKELAVPADGDGSESEASNG